MRLKLNIKLDLTETNDHKIISNLGTHWNGTTITPEIKAYILDAFIRKPIYIISASGQSVDNSLLGFIDYEYQIDLQG